MEELTRGLFGTEYKVKDHKGRIVWNSRWFLGCPSIYEVMEEDNPPPDNSPGYNIPLWTESLNWKRLWWNVTDHETNIVPYWSVVSRESFLIWLQQLGFTGYSARDWDETPPQRPRRRRISYRNRGGIIF